MANQHSPISHHLYQETLIAMRSGHGVVSGALERQAETTLSFIDNFVEKHGVSNTSSWLQSMVMMDAQIDDGPMPSLNSLIQLGAELETNEIEYGSPQFNQKMRQVADAGVLGSFIEGEDGQSQQVGNGHVDDGLSEDHHLMPAYKHQQELLKWAESGGDQDEIASVHRTIASIETAMGKPSAPTPEPAPVAPYKSEAEETYQPEYDTAYTPDSEDAPALDAALEAAISDPNVSVEQFESMVAAGRQNSAPEPD